MLRYIFWTILFYGLFKLIFHFIIPVFKATRQMKSQVREFQDSRNTDGQFRSTASQPSAAEQQQGKNKKAKGDYIDFEELSK